jgi:hypothetical protein
VGGEDVEHSENSRKGLKELRNTVEQLYKSILLKSGPTGILIQNRQGVFSKDIEKRVP